MPSKQPRPKGQKSHGMRNERNGDRFRFCKGKPEYLSSPEISHQTKGKQCMSMQESQSTFLQTIPEENNPLYRIAVSNNDRFMRFNPLEDPAKNNRLQFATYLTQ